MPRRRKRRQQVVVVNPWRDFVERVGWTAIQALGGALVVVLTSEGVGWAEAAKFVAVTGLIAVLKVGTAQQVGRRNDGAALPGGTAAVAVLTLVLAATLALGVAPSAKASNSEPGSGPGGCTYAGQVIRLWPGGPLYTCPSAAEINAELAAEATGYQANTSADYNEDPGSGGTEWRRTGEGIGCGWLMVAWEEFYYGTNYKTGRAECRWVWQ